MQNLNDRSEFSGGPVVSLRGEIGDFSQSDCRKEQEKEPCAATEVSCGITPKKPGGTCNREHDEGRDTPGCRGDRAGAPCPGQDEQR